MPTSFLQKCLKSLTRFFETHPPAPIPPHLELGRKGESLAESWLRKMGYRTIAKNFSSKFGELDLICWDQDCLVFVEVKTRSHEKWARPADAVRSRKKRAICRTALYFLRTHRYPEIKFRFDIVEVILADPAPPEIRHIINAFPLVKPYRYP